MKNGITDILSSLFSSPSDKAGLSQGKGSVAGKGSQPEESTFEDVLAQLASQDPSSAAAAAGDNSGESGAPVVEGLPSASGDSGASAANGKFFESLTSLSEVDVKISEHIKVDSLSQLAQAEQALVSLAAGLSQLIGILSGAQGTDSTQAQKTLVSLSGGTLSMTDAQSILDSLKAMIPKVSDNSDPLLLSPDQQGAFLNQMLQQMIQNQQVLFGTLPNSASAVSPGGGTAALSGAGAFQSSDVFLQLSFSDTQITQVQRTNTQSSTVFIDLQSFQMSATFIQNGTADLSGNNSGAGPSFQPLPASGPLSNALDQFFANQLLTGNAAPTAIVQSGASSDKPRAQDDLNKNFKNLVQMLVQAGASQAVLTSVLNHQRDISNTDLNRSLVQTISMDDLAKSLAPNVEIAPAPPADNVFAGIGNTDNSSSALTSQLFVEQMFAQSSSVVETVNDPQTLAAPSAVGSGSSVLSAASTLGRQTADQTQVLMDANVINAMNDAVARLNVLATQFAGLNPSNSVGSGTVKPSLSLDQLLGALDLSAPALPSTPPVAGGNSANAFHGDDLVNEAALVNETIAVSQVFQNQGLVGRTVPSQEKTENAVLISRVQLIQTGFASAGVELGGDVNAKVLAGNGPVNSVLTGFTDPHGSNDLSPLTIQAPVELNPTVQSALAPNITATAQPQPLSPVSISVQEMIVPNSVDVQVKVIDPADSSAQLNVQFPMATTAGTTIAASTSQNVPATVVSGEAVKLTIQAPTAAKNTDAQNQLSGNNPPSLTGVQPIQPLAVTSVAAGSEFSFDLKTGLDQSKITNNHSLDLQLNPNLLPGLAASIAKGSAADNKAVDISTLNKIDSLQILNQVTDQVMAHATEAKAVSRMSFQLIPESLGRVTVQIALVDQAVSAKIIVSHPDVKEVLQHHMVELKTALNQAGLQIDQLQVQIQGGSSNLLAQYYQYQQEGFNYRLPVDASAATEEAKSLENTGVSGDMSVRTSLVDVLA